MRTRTTTYYALLPLALVARQASCFPSHLAETMMKINGMAAEARRSDSGGGGGAAAAPECPFAQQAEKRQAKGITPPFDPIKQYVSNQGIHEFRPPTGNDQRGPCPGLNAMANHGYLPRNGVATIPEFISGTMEAFGMGLDLATFLSVYGAVFDGDLAKFSVGGAAPSSLLDAVGLLGQPQGLSGSHNKYEGDASPVFGDLYLHGESSPQLSQFKALYEMGQRNGDRVDLGVLTEYRLRRFEESKSENPYFFLAPFSGVVVTTAAYTFIYRFMANKTAEEPEGYLDGETLKAFYGVEGKRPEDFVLRPGHERFPDDWHKRHPIDAYTIPYLVEDALAMQLEHPEFLSVGGNLGEVDSFVGVEPADLTDGLFNSPDLLKGNAAFCFAAEAALQQAPDLLRGLFGDITRALDKITGAVGDAASGLGGCPQIASFDQSLFDRFPGFSKLNAQGRYD